MNTQVATTADGRPIMVRDKPRSTESLRVQWVSAYEQAAGTWSAYIGDADSDAAESP